MLLQEKEVKKMAGISNRIDKYISCKKGERILIEEKGIFSNEFFPNGVCRQTRF